MAVWKLPPQAKVYEALSAVGDGRVTRLGPGEAEVRSSSGRRTYNVEWTPDLAGIRANDNGSYWQGYLGYPSIAVLMTLGRVTYEEASARALAGVPWQELNRRFRRDYDAAVAEVLAGLEGRGVATAPIVADAARIMAQLEGMELTRLPRRARPPKEG